MNLMVIFQGRESQVISRKKTSFNIGQQHLKVFCLISVTWYDDRNFWTVQFEMGFTDLDLQSRSPVYEKAKTFVLNFLANFSIDVDEVWWAAMRYWFVQAQVTVASHDQYKQERTLLWWFMKYSFLFFYIGFCLGSLELIFVKHCLTIDCTQLHILILLTLTQDYIVMWKLELVQSFLS